MSAQQPIPLWNRALGGLLFAAGLGVWVRLSLDLLPYTYHDLHYLLTLEGGPMGPVEWVHPLFVPLLGAYRWALGLAGYSGPMLLPLERANLAVGALALSALFVLSARLCRDAAAAAAAALAVGFAQGFWAGALRPDPYALAAAGTVAALALLLPAPGEPRRRYLLGGAAAGLTIGLHASGLALLPVAAVAAWSRAGAGRRAARLLGLFAAAAAAAAALCYLLLLAYHRVGPETLRHAGFLETFHNIEQMPQSSIYTSGRWSKQAADLLSTLQQHAGKGLLALLALLAGLALRPRALRGSAAVGLASAVSYAAFFLINNTQNGFVFSVFLSLPLLLGVLAGLPKALRLSAGAALLAALSLSLPDGPPRDGPAGDPFFSEARFLRGLLGKGDLLVLPGCPFPELMYEGRFDVLQAGDAAPPESMCLVPAAQADELTARLTDRLAAGGRVFFGAGSRDAPAGESGDLGGAQKRRQAFFTAGGPEREAAAVGALARRLRASFELDCGLRSPRGWAYCRLRPRRGTRARPRAPARASPPAASLVLEEQAGGRDFHAMRLRYLSAWLADSPGDRFVRGDLERLVSGRLQPEQRLAAAPPTEAERAARAAAALVEEGIAHFRAGRRAPAERAFKRAISADKGSVSAWLSLGAALDAAGRHGQALGCYDRVLALGPLQGDVRADALAARANALAALGRAEPARRDRREALRSASAAWPWRKDLEAALR